VSYYSKILLPRPFSRHQDEKIHVLDAAEKEVGKMLQENLLQKFIATKEYGEANAMVKSLSA